MIISLVIPTYNERDNIIALIESVHKVLDAATLAHEIIIVDDNSPDGTWQIAEQAAVLDPRIKVVRRGGRLGLATAAVEGWKIAQGEFLAIMDGDFQHPPGTLLSLFHALQSCGADVAIASRHIDGGGICGWSLHRYVVSWAGTLLAAWFLPGILARVRDPLSGYFMFRRSAAPPLQDIAPRGYKILLELLSKGRFRLIQEVPFTFMNRTQGRSKFGLYQSYEFLLHLLILAWQEGSFVHFIKYCTTGAIGVAVNVSAFNGFIHFGQFPLVLAGALSVQVAILSNFILNEFWTFSQYTRLEPSLRHLLKRCVSFNIICLGGAVMNVGILWGTVNLLGIHPAIGIFIAVGLSTLWNFGISANITWIPHQQNTR